MISLDTAAVVTWSGRESSATMTLRTIRGEERRADYPGTHNLMMVGGVWSRDLRCHSGVSLTRSLDKVYMCETGEAGEDGDNSVSCFIADNEGEWEKLFTTGELRVLVEPKLWMNYE